MENCIKNDLILNVKNKDIRRFKAGAELTGQTHLKSQNFKQIVLIPSCNLEF